MDPIVAKNTSHEDAMMMLENVRTCPALNKEGEKNSVDGLKRGYRAYRSNARLVPSEFDYKKDNAAIISWHYKLHLRSYQELREDSKARGSCRYCCRHNAKCNCSCNLRFYWEAAQLLSLVMPSSDAAKRMFSLLVDQFNNHQTRSLGDLIYL